MSHLEQLISRYLDGELNDGELRELRRQLDESPEARALLREMTAVTRSARAIPSLDAPSAGLEARLFHRLHVEGLHRDTRPVAIGSAARSLPVRSRALRRPAAAILLLLLFSVTTSYWLSDRADQMADTIAEAPRSAPTPDAPRRNNVTQAPAEASSPLLSSRAPLWTPRSIVPREGRPGNSRSGNRSFESRRDADRPVRLMEKRDQQKEPLVAARQQPPQVPNAPEPNVPEVQTPEMPVRDNGSSMIAVAPDHLPDPLANIPSADPMPAPPSTGGKGIFAASFRPTGLSFVGDDRSSPELSVRFDARVGRDHQLSFIVGRSSVRSEQRATELIAASPATTVTDGRTNAPRGINGSASQERSSVELENETWGGVAYSYTLLHAGRIELAGGVKAGAGEKSLRVGLEATGRYSLSDVISVEVAPTVTQVIPHRQATATMMLEDESTGTLSFGTSKHSTFTSVGVEVGVRIAIR